MRTRINVHCSNAHVRSVRAFRGRWKLIQYFDKPITQNEIRLSRTHTHTPHTKCEVKSHRFDAQTNMENRVTIEIKMCCILQRIFFLVWFSQVEAVNYQWIIRIEKGVAITNV